mmetsp:Transcript_17801/g.53704  ORF Transcript_17801/g.53704 Transcript_17801/m.53704 type:complete len:268 (-) Transcript_17801:290-1093(-)
MREPTRSASSAMRRRAPAREPGAAPPAHAAVAAGVSPAADPGPAAPACPPLRLPPIRAVTSASSSDRRSCILAAKSSMSSLVGAALPAASDVGVGWSERLCASRTRTWKSVRAKRRAFEHSMSSSSISLPNSRVWAISRRKGSASRPMAPNLWVQPAHACSSCRAVRRWPPATCRRVQTTSLTYSRACTSARSSRPSCCGEVFLVRKECTASEGLPVQQVRSSSSWTEMGSDSRYASIASLRPRILFVKLSAAPRHTLSRRSTACCA